MAHRSSPTEMLLIALLASQSTFSPPPTTCAAHCLLGFLRSYLAGYHLLLICILSHHLERSFAAPLPPLERISPSQLLISGVPPPRLPVTLLGPHNPFHHHSYPVIEHILHPLSAQTYYGVVRVSYSQPPTVKLFR